VTGLPDLFRAARMAYRVIAARGITALPVHPLPILRACRDTTVMTGEEAAEQIGMRPHEFERFFDRADAFTLRQEAAGKTRYIVVYRPGGNPEHLRFTLAHELGHRLLGHTGAGQSEEREADCFASHLLCPQPYIDDMREQHGELCAEQIAQACYVSIACARNLARRPRYPEEDPVLLRVKALLTTKE